MKESPLITSIQITDEEVNKLLQLDEGHFVDLKSIDITPAKLTRSISAFANAEGGELYVGIEDSPRVWNGFKNVEAANGHIQCFDDLFPLGDGFSYEFLHNPSHPGSVLKIEVGKNRTIKSASNGTPYVRRAAQCLPVNNPEALTRLERSKGIVSYETEVVGVEVELIENSVNLLEFILDVVPTTEPLPWLKKQRLVINDHPTVAGVLLFSEEPQAILPKQSGLKIYQYTTKEDEGEREDLAFDPITIEGNLYDMITMSVERTKEVIEKTRIMTTKGLKSATYPSDALHEIITNAVLHRDYSMADDIHIRIYDNRVEIQSPGKLPAHITPENILEERYARNGVIVRLINKFPNPPNKDVGEGLNTAFNAMRDMRLKDPLVTQMENNVVVTLKHESLGTPEELIMEYLDSHDTITNREARAICNIGSENAMKHTLKKLAKSGLLEVIAGETIFKTSYKKSSS